MTHRPNAITHTQEYTVLPGVVRHTFIIFGLFTTPNLCPPDTKSWRRHCLGCFHRHQTRFHVEVLLGRQLDCNLSDAASVYQFFIVQVLSVSFFPSSCRNRSSWKCYSLSSSYSSCFMVMDRRLRQNKLLCTVFNANWDRSYVYHITSNPKQIISGSRTCVQVEFVKHNSHMQNMAVAHSGKKFR